jgi:Uncharacterised protein family (UPF0236)
LARLFPQGSHRLVHRRKRKLSLRTQVGEVVVEIDHGQDKQTGKWFCPQQEVWGLGAHQKLTPLLQDKLAFTVTATASYEEAAALSAKWGCAVDDSTLHALVQRMGAKAEAQMEQRVQSPPAELEPQRKASELAVLLADGWMARFRGPGWGRKKSPKPAVEWHEIKTGVFYTQEQAAQGPNGRGMLTEKVIVNWQGEPDELGRRLNWEALRRGLARAKNTLMLSDGSAWIWNLKEDRWNHAFELLDFYHASQHLWRVAQALKGEAQAARWVEPRLHQLRHGKQQKVLAEVAQLQGSPGEVAKIIREEQGYFARQAGRMNYAWAAKRGWPIGSGAVESACRQKQCRFKRPGQFWTRQGFRHLCALDEARRNGHWNALWK